MTDVERVGTTPIAAAFFAGRYAEVLSATLDSPHGGADDEDIGFVVGALAFVGRIVEAELLLDGVRARRTLSASRTLAAGAFFLSIAHCRAGRLADGERALLAGVRETGGTRDAWARSLLLQGVAGCRFFAADYRRAARAATRALASAQVARFAYAQLLANDMRGHVLLRLGRFHEGLALLERARGQAKNLGLTSNAHAIEISLALHRAALGRIEDFVATLEALLEREEAQDSYSRRSILLELATRAAWMGRGERASTLLEAAAPLCAGDDRAEAALLNARAHRARVADGWPAARVLAERALALLPKGADPSREAEILAVLLGAATFERDESARARAVERLRALHGRTGLYRAQAALFVEGELDPSVFTPAEPDVATRTLAAVRAGPVATAVDEGLLGLVPEALGRAPGRCLYLLDEHLVIEDRGEVSRLPPLAPRSRDVLRALVRGPMDRESLLEAVWGIRSYRPERHDFVIKTTVSRLRSALGDRAAWVETEQGAYRLRPGVEVATPNRAAGPRNEAAADDEDLELIDGGQPSRAAARRSSRIRHALAALERMGEATVSELAREVGASVRTMSRDLSSLVSTARVTRAGTGPATRYRVAVREERNRGVA